MLFVNAFSVYPRGNFVPIFVFYFLVNGKLSYCLCNAGPMIPDIMGLAKQDKMTKQGIRIHKRRWTCGVSDMEKSPMSWKRILTAP